MAMEDSLPKIIKTIGVDDIFFIQNFGSSRVLSPSQSLLVVGLGAKVMIVANFGCPPYKKFDTISSFVAYQGDTIKNVQFSPSGEQIISTSVKGLVRVWDNEGKLLHEISDETDPIHLASLGENDVVFTNSLSNVNKIWSLPRRSKL